MYPPQRARRLHVVRDTRGALVYGLRELAAKADGVGAGARRGGLQHPAQRALRRDAAAANGTGLNSIIHFSILPTTAPVENERMFSKHTHFLSIR
ncbi:hypothetical protein EVAR_65396_1 [Eumeta japonica]|uniref:Uncharacterized protein n=1 Tax=Eumeta variegata TaxID=151549 RepID=A0A4C1ZKE7_EUMVA|nr:hypothetical protein EVAR_65396_1 [Eumeta japonica]